LGLLWNGAFWLQGRQQHLFDPSGDGQMRATGLKQHWRQPVRAALRHDQVGTAVVFATDPPEDLPAADGPPMVSLANPLSSKYTTLVLPCWAIQ
jgi:hypothetical protein